MSQIIFIPHGGGPLPLLGDPGYARLATMLRGLSDTVARAKAIVVVTAHWETEHPTLSASTRPGMLYDYNGFPEESYRINYPAPGAPALAEALAQALSEGGFRPGLDYDRGFDHGTFVPMTLVRPEADIPVLQMSVLSSLDPEEHLALGNALAPVIEGDIVLIGSGFSFHNLKALTGRLSEEAADQGRDQAIEFHGWLDRIVCDPELSATARHLALADWAKAPGARFCQPREEHLLPLHVCAGAAAAKQLTARSIFSEAVKGYQTSGYHWQ
jgi:aromatic ring-opening dioxygenase catalytic subunit (LigB family)